MYKRRKRARIEPVEHLHFEVGQRTNACDKGLVKNSEAEEECYVKGTRTLESLWSEPR